MTGKRKLIIAFLALLSFTIIMVKSSTIDPFALGLGIGGILATVMYGYHQEYKYKNEK